MTFDYKGWEKWGDWKRSQHAHDTNTQENHRHSCSESCDFPSQCYWMPRHLQEISLEAAINDAKASLSQAGSSTTTTAVPADTPTQQPREWKLDLEPIEEETSHSPINDGAGLGLDPSFGSCVLEPGRYKPENGPTFDDMPFIEPLETSKPEKASEKQSLSSVDVIKSFDFGFGEEDIAEQVSPLFSGSGLAEWAEATIGIALNNPWSLVMSKTS